MSSSKRAAFLKQPKNLIQDEKELERHLKDLKSELEKVDNAIAKERETLRELEIVKADLDNQEGQDLIGKAVKSKLVKRSEISKLKKRMMALESDIATNDNILSKYQEYKNILLKISPSLWQEAQEPKTSKAEIPQNEENSESDEAAISKGLEKGLKLSPDRELPLESMLPSSQDDTLVASCDLFSDCAEGKEILEIDSDVQQVLAAESTLLCDIELLKESSRADLTLEEAIMKKRHIVKEDEEKLTQQANEEMARIEEEKERAKWFRKKVESHQQDESLMEALDKKVTNIYSHCGNTHSTNLSTTEKIEAVGNHMSKLIDEIKKIPAVQLKELRKKKRNERKKREQMERHRLEEEKRHEKMEMHKKRAMEKTLKTTGRKLMPRSNPDNMKVEAVSEPTEPAQQDPFSFTFPDFK